MTKNIYQRIDVLHSRRLKHLPGEHDQRDHAWNRGMGGGIVAPLHALANTIANAMQSKVGGLISRINALLGNQQVASGNQSSDVSSTSLENNPTADAIATTMQPKIGGLLSRINALLKRPSAMTVAPSREATPAVNTTPALPEGYDTTRFDTPSEYAPRPIKPELFMPGGEVYEQLLSIFKSGNYAEYDDQNADNIISVFRDMSFPSSTIHHSRWQFSNLDDIKRIFQDMQNMNIDEILGISIENPLLSNEIYQSYQDFVQQQRSEVTMQDVMENDDPRMKRFRDETIEMYNKMSYWTPEQIEQSKNQVLTKAQQNFNVYNFQLAQDYDSLSSMVEEPMVQIVAIRKRIEDKLTELQQQIKDNPNDQESIQQEQNLQKVLSDTFFNPALNRIWKLVSTEDGKVQPISFQTIKNSVSPVKIMEVLNNVYEYNALPETSSWNDLISEQDAYTYEGESEPVVLYRTIRDAGEKGASASSSGSTELSAQQIFESTLTSDIAHVGLGIDGMGMYFKSRSSQKTRDIANNAKKAVQNIMNGIMPTSLSELGNLGLWRERIIDILSNAQDGRELGIKGSSIEELLQMDLENTNINQLNGIALQSGRTGREPNAPVRYGRDTFAATINKQKNPNIFNRPINSSESDDVALSIVRNEFSKRYESLFRGYPDLGVMMQMLGYDAYKAREFDFAGADNWVIINRGILKISDTMLSNDVDEDTENHALQTGMLP